MANTRKLQSTEGLWQSVRASLLRHMHASQSVTVAYSGGVDSSVLLDLLHAHRNEGLFSELRAVHINHGLNDRAMEWAEHCHAFCQSREIPFTLCHVDVIRNGGQGIEAAARRARYAALEEIAADWVLLAHHREDQAETLLLNLLRGAGVAGAAGMSEVRGRYLRPLLTVSRTQIHAYALQSNLSWVEDDSNADHRYSRNFLRNEVFPILARCFPAASKNLAKSAALFGDADALLETLARQDQNFNGPLKISGLRALTESRGVNLLAYYLRQHGVQIPGSARLHEIHRQLLTAGPDRQPSLKLGKWSLRRYRDEVHLMPGQSAPSAPVTWTGQSVVAWEGGKILFRPAAGSGLSSRKIVNRKASFRPRIGGERMKMHAGAPARSLKDLLRESNIPPWERWSLPLMYCDGELVWVAGIGVSAEYRTEPGEPGYTIEFERTSW